MASIILKITHSDGLNSAQALHHVTTRLDGWDYGEKYELIEEEPDDDYISRQAWNQVAGRVSAFKEVQELLNQRAGELYVNDKDDQAKVVRDLVKSLEPKLKEAEAELDRHIKRSRKSRGT